MDNHGNRISEQVQSSTARGNDHDPLCLMFCDECDECDDAYCCLDCDGYGCECWIISRVRADEREQAAQRMEAPALHEEWCVWAKPMPLGDRCDCYHARCIAAARGETQ